MAGGIDSYTVLMLHMDGSDASTTFTDSSASAHTVTRQGNAQIDTAQSKFGGASGLFDNSGDYLTTPDSDDWFFGTGDFTIDCWVRLGDTSVNYLYHQYNGANDNISFYLASETTVTLFVNVGGSIKINKTWTVSTMSTGTWYHIALARSGTTFDLYLDGLKQGTSLTSSESVVNNGGTLYIGLKGGDNLAFNGWIDEYRVSKGIARWTADFTPPTSEYTGPTNITVDVNSLTLTGAIVTTSLQISPNINVNALSLIGGLIIPEEVGAVTTVNVNSLGLTLSLETPSFSIDTVVSPTTLSLVSQLLSPIIPQDRLVNVSALDLIATLENAVGDVTYTYAANAQRIISYNPLIFVANSPSKLVVVDVTVPASPTWTTYLMPDIDYPQDVVVDTNLGFIYVVGTNGVCIRILLSDLNNQTVIDLSETDNLTLARHSSGIGLTYITTNNVTGELYLLDDRTTYEIDSDFSCLAPYTFQLDSDFNIVDVYEIGSEFYLLAETTYSIPTSFICLTDVVDNVTPLNPSDVHVYIDNVEVATNDLVGLPVITHSLDEESRATFRLTRRHDAPDINLNGATMQITNQNALKIIVNGITEFDGKISDWNPTYELRSEYIDVVALQEQSATDYQTITMSLPSLNSRLNLYNVLIQAPKISNPYIDPSNEDNPKKYKGIRVSLGKQITEVVSRYLVYDTNNSIATTIENGSFNPQQNWTYFWSPTIRHIGISIDSSTQEVIPLGFLELGETTTRLFNYVGTSLSSLGTKLWKLVNAKHRKQRIYPNKEVLLGDGVILSAYFDDVLGTTSSAIMADLQSNGYINGGGTVQTKFKSVLKWEDLDTNLSEKIAQQVYDIVVSKMGYTIGTAPYKTISVQAGAYKPQIKWTDEDDGLYAVTAAKYDYTAYAQKIAQLEYQKLLNINGTILPDTSATLTFTVDAYYFFGINLLTRINIDNTTQAGVFDNANGFPISVKSLTIDLNTMQVTAQANNTKSSEELRVIDGQYPDENDPAYFQEEKSSLIALKTDMKTGLTVS